MKKISLLMLLLFTYSAGLVTCSVAQGFTLYDPGTEEIVDYAKYGEFKNIGSAKYSYIINNLKGLQKAVGEGIYPDTNTVLRDPDYKKYKREKKLEGSQWLYINDPDYQANFYKWATIFDDPGVKLFFTARAMERAGLLTSAIKAYYAIVVHFPKSFGITYWKTPWYVGTSAIDRIYYLTEQNPELGIKLVDAKIAMLNGYNNTTTDDEFIINPGKLIKVKPQEILPSKKDISRMSVKHSVCSGEIKLVQYENGHWQLFVKDLPYIIKCVAYTPAKIGQSPDDGTMEDWMIADYNKNDRIDSPYDAWVDKNRNNSQENDELPVGDFQLLKDMGVNTIRLYHHASNKKLLLDLYNNYGIRVLMGDLLGMYAVGSGAAWDEGTDYTNPQHQKNMIESVMEMVNNFKDETYLLAWVMGNENNYGAANNAPDEPIAYYKFANQVAKMIKAVDPKHPVIISNGDLQFLDIFAEHCPDIDIFGTNAYRSFYGFGFSFWNAIKDLTNKPVFITEYGCSAYGRGISRDDAEEYQAEFLKNSWRDITANIAGGGTGNALGGSLFEFIDEWWKTGAPPGYPSMIQDITPNFPGEFVDGWLYEEWLGVVSQGNGMRSPYMRQLRPAYFVYQKLWQEKETCEKNEKIESSQRN
ncbi:MAG: glycoside hydrolase family 2 TIM barrel-domain containing protein [Candidatus Omnitrophota bacterium]